MILLLVGLSTFTVGLSHATSCYNLQQSQLASLNERMNQMINALYPQPYSKAKAASSYQSTTTAPPTEYSTVAPYDPSYYQGYQQIGQPPVVYMSQQTPTTVAISPPTPGSPPTVTIQTTRVPSPPCYSYEGQEYYSEPKPYPPYFEYTYSSQYPPPPSYPVPPPPYTPPECPCHCQQPTEYQSCPQRQYPAQAPPTQPEYQGGCPPAPPCSPPPLYSPGPYPQPNYPPPSPYAPPSYPAQPSYPPPGSYPPQPCPPPPPYSTYPNSPQYPQNAQYPQNSQQYPQNSQYPPAPTYTNPRDMMQPPQY